MRKFLTVAGLLLMVGTLAACESAKSAAPPSAKSAAPASAKPAQSAPAAKSSTDDLGE